MVTVDDRRRPEGWAWGITFEKREWLTIAGSAIESAALTVDMDGAVPPPPIVGHPHVLARVQRRGDWFRILEFAPEERQHVLILARDDKYRHLVTGWCSCSTYTYENGFNRFADGWRFTGSAAAVVVTSSYQRNHARAVAGAGRGT